MPTASGPFQVTMHPEPPFNTDDGLSLGRMTGDKVFEGALDATSTVWMTSVMTAVKGSAAYVALEKISGTLDGKRGSFVVQHAATMDRGAPTLEIRIVPDSGTGELVGIRGRMEIEYTNGHGYVLEYELG